MAFSSVIIVKTLNKNTAAFFELVRSGLWENKARLLPYDNVNYLEVMRLAEEQAVVGLVTAGLENVVDVKVPKEELLQFIGETLQIEERNKTMNAFIRVIVEKMRHEDIYTLLVKGQGVAQCYERPLWRSAGDIDFYLSESNYEKAKAFLCPLAQSIEPEDKRRLHLGMRINSWVVELHGTLHTGISKRMNKISDEVHHVVFYGGNVRSWNNNGVTVFLPNANNDVIIIFNHFINHFYGEGIGLRQICDWCRLMWMYKSEIDVTLLNKRIKKMGLMKEWKVFGAFAVEYIGMPVNAMPFYIDSDVNKRKIRKLAETIIETGHIRATSDDSYRISSSKVARNITTFWRRLKDFKRVGQLFPCNTPIFFANYLVNRVKALK